MKRCPRCESRYRDGVSQCLFDGAALQVLDDPLIGRVVGGRYLIEKRVGAGGMATVYRGRHQALDREVALKVLHPKLAAEDEHRQRFLREARTANRVQHENVVDIVDMGETEDNLVYLVMEYLRGSTLAGEIEKGALALHRACHIGHQVARALARAHALGVVHRDVKPDNVFLLERGGDTDFVKLLDFGLARSSGDVALTRSNSVFGTPGYMAPEQINGGQVGPATDLYAFGCLLYEILTGALPFEGSVPAILDQHVHAEPPRLRQRRPDLPPALDALVRELLDKSAARRPASAYRVADALAALLGSLPARVDELGATASAKVSKSPSRASLRAEEHLWDTHVEDLRRRAVAAHAGRTLPPWLAETLLRMGSLAAQVRAGRDRLEKLAAASMGAHLDSRSANLRIGQALDALAIHDLELVARLAAVRQQLDHARPELTSEANALLKAAEQLDAPPSGRAVLPELGLPSLGLVRAWARAHRAVVEIEQLRQRLLSERDDLAFQIAQLKGRLGAGHAVSSVEHEEHATRDGTLDADLRAKTYALRLDADRLAEHLSELARAPDAKRA